MATELKLRRGTTSQHSSFTGAEAEVTIDTDKETVVVHDGATVGGYPVAREDMSNVPNDTISGDQIAGGDATFDSINVDSGTLFVDSANNRVGVGTSSPAAPLHIDEFANPEIRLQIQGNSGYNTISTETGNQLAFGVTGSEAARIDSNGNVGIGTSSPDSSLDVNGVTRFSVANNFVQPSTAPSFELIRFSTNAGLTPSGIIGSLLVAVSLNRGTFNNDYGTVFIDASFIVSVAERSFQANQAAAFINENVNQLIASPNGANLTGAAIEAEVSHDGGTTFVTPDQSNQGNTDVIFRLVLRATANSGMDRWSIHYTANYSSLDNNALVSNSIVDIT